MSAPRNRRLRLDVVGMFALFYAAALFIPLAIGLLLWAGLGLLHDAGRYLLAGGAR